MTLLRPEWLLAWPLVGLLIWSLRREASARWQSHIDPQLLQPLLQGGKDRYNQIVRFVGLISLLLLPLALAGPAIEVEAEDALQERPMVIIMDQSPSMLATDVSPNRYTRARQKVQDWLAAHPGRPTALVAYSGTAHVVTPLSFDHNTITLMLRQLHPEMMPRPGSHPVAALALAAELLSDQAGDVLWLTDSLSTEQRIRLQDQLDDRVAQLGIIALGTDIGGPAIRRDGTPVRDTSGNPLEPVLDSSELSILADSNQVSWHPLTPDDTDWQSVLTEAQLEGSQAGLDRNTVTRDLGLWLLVALLPGVLLLYGRGQLMVIPLALSLTIMTPRAEASPLDWFRSPDQQGAAMLAEDPRAAMDIFSSQQWRIYAALEAGEYRQALQWLESPDSARDHYHRGNALVHLQRFEEALEAYDEALRSREDFSEARHNRDLVEQFLERMAESGQPDEQEAAPGPADPGGGSQRGDGSPALPGDGSGQGDMTDSGAEALESSIRQRMPEQDASFLERKFRFQYEAEPDNYDDTGPTW